MDNEDIKKQIDSLKQRLDAVEKFEPLNRFSPPEEKDNANEAIYDSLSSFFFDKVRFISFPFTEVTSDHTDYYQSTTLYSGESRLTDTSEGKYMNPSRASRMRCSFYVHNADALTGYILSPAVYDSFSSLNTISSMSILRSYVGVKFKLGEIFVVVKETNRPETEYKTGLSFSGTGDSDTWLLEIKYFVENTEIYINDTFIGRYKTDFGKTQTNYTYLPLLSPAISSDGTGVNITLENYQFIQDN